MPQASFRKKRWVPLIGRNSGRDVVFILLVGYSFCCATAGIMAWAWSQDVLEYPDINIGKTFAAACGLLGTIAAVASIPAGTGSRSKIMLAIAALLLNAIIVKFLT